MAAEEQDFLILPMAASDWDAVRAIYLEGIATGNATFEREVPEWTRWQSGHLSCCRLVARLHGDVTGWAALSAVSTRRVYSGVAEVSIYVAAKARGQKIGGRLLGALIEASERAGLWTLQAGIFPENVASIEMHKRAGFRTVGTRERLSCLDGAWRDVTLLERRSPRIGI